MVFILNLFSSATNFGILLSTNPVETLFLETINRSICRPMTGKDQVCKLLAELCSGFATGHHRP